jgi:hypothetical protein
MGRDTLNTRIKFWIRDLMHRTASDWIYEVKDKREAYVEEYAFLIEELLNERKERDEAEHPKDGIIVVDRMKLLLSIVDILENDRSDIPRSVTTRWAEEIIERCFVIKF